jgi:hypothetical protein
MQTKIDGTPILPKPIAGTVIRGKGKHFAKFRDDLIEVAEKNPDFKLIIKES